MKPVATKQAEKIAKLEALLIKHGVCVHCGEMYDHHLEAPFASCGCGTSEWYNFTPYMALQHEQDKLLKASEPFRKIAEGALRQNLRHLARDSDPVYAVDSAVMTVGHCRDLVKTFEDLKR
jgi:hypothetical protein